MHIPIPARVHVCTKEVKVRGRTARDGSIEEENRDTDIHDEATR
jgi:hypothetical protein